MEWRNKIVGSVLSVILVVGVVLGLVALVQGGQQITHSVDRVGRRGGGGGRGGGGVSISNKALVDMCATSSDKEMCHSSILPLLKMPNPSMKDFLSGTLGSTMGELNKAIEITNKFNVDKGDDPYNDQLGIEDCREFLDDAFDELNAAIFSAGKLEIKSMQDRMQEFIGWLTGVLVDQTTCVDQIDKPEYKQRMKDSLSNTTRLTTNAIYFFSQMKTLAGAFDLKAGAGGVLGRLDNIARSAGSNFRGISGGMGNGIGVNVNQQQTGASRRLFDAEVRASRRRGYPSWVTTKDRRLLQGAPGAITPNAVVAQDGSGQFRTINEAINSIPPAKNGAPDPGRFIIHVKAGIYNEVVLIKKKPHVFIYGDGPGKTIITGDLSVALKKVKTSNSATIGVDSDWFMIKSVTIRNTAGPDGHQAVALRIAGQYAVVFDCSIEAYQDTLYYHRGKQFYKNCVISGTVDFIFGNGRAIIQDSTIIARKPNPNQKNMVTADGGLTPMGEHGLVLQNCKITGENELMAAKDQFPTYLGRPWKAYAVTVFMQSDIGDHIVPEGYSIFTNVGPGSTNQETAVYAEYMNTGPGAITDRRDKNTFQKFQLLSPQQAQGYTIGTFLEGGAWLSSTGVPFKIGL